MALPPSPPSSSEAERPDRGIEQKVSLRELVEAIRSAPPAKRRKNTE